MDRFFNSAKSKESGSGWDSAKKHISAGIVLLDDPRKESAIIHLASVIRTVPDSARPDDPESNNILLFNGQVFQGAEAELIIHSEA